MKRTVTALCVVVAVGGVSQVATGAPASAVKHVVDKKARKDLRKLSRKFDRLQQGFSAAPDRSLSNLDESRLGAAEQNARDAKIAVKGLNVGTFPNGAIVTVKSERDDGTYGTTDPPQPVGGGAKVATFRFVNCPDGSAVVSGGYATIGRSRFAHPDVVFFQHISGNGYAVGIDNEGIDPIRVIVEANCVPGMVSNQPNDHALEKQWVQDQNASH